MPKFITIGYGDQAGYDRTPQIVRDAAHAQDATLVPANCGSNYHMYYILLDTIETRTRLIDFLKQKNIFAVFHYVLPSFTMSRCTALPWVRKWDLETACFR